MVPSASGAASRDHSDGARREKPLLAFACTNSGRGRSGVVVNGLRGWLVERYPLKGVDVETWVPGGAVGEQAAAVARALHHREATPARAGAGDGLRGARRVRMREFPPLGTTRMLGSGNAKRRGRYGLA